MTAGSGPDAPRKCFNSAIDGYLDLCAPGLVSGWAWDRRHPEKRLVVEIRLDGEPVATVTAQQYREDLKHAGFGDGAYAFNYYPRWPIDPKSRNISATVSGTGFRLREVIKPRRRPDDPGEPSFTPVDPWPRPSREDCGFYHCLNFPAGETIENANWDLRGRFESYIGGYPVRGKSVLDVGTASGFLAFSAEEAGAASVTAVDALHAREFERIPFKDSLHTADRRLWIAETEENLKRLKNGFWYAWHKKGSSVDVVYAPVSQLWRWDRKFDVVIAGAIVEHLSDPVPFLTALAGLASEAVIIAHTQVVDSEQQFMETLNSWDIPQFNYSWWILSKGLYNRVFGNLGFECEFAATTAKCNELNPPIEVGKPTIIARRQKR